jgi:hypothetical protein
LLIVIFEREEKLSFIGAVNEGHGGRAVLKIRRLAGVLIRDQRTDEW